MGPELSGGFRQLFVEFHVFSARSWGLLAIASKQHILLELSLSILEMLDFENIDVGSFYGFLQSAMPPFKVVCGSGSEVPTSARRW